METKLEQFRLTIRQKRISKLEKELVIDNSILGWETILLENELKQAKGDIQLLAELLTGALDDLKKRAV